MCERVEDEVLLVCCNVPVASLFFHSLPLLDSLNQLFFLLPVYSCCCSILLFSVPILALSLSQMHSVYFNLALTTFTQLEIFCSIYLVYSCRHTLCVFKAHVSKHVKTTVYFICDTFSLLTDSGNTRGYVTDRDDPSQL